MRPAKSICLNKKQSYEELKAQLDIDRQERSKDTQTDFAFRFEDIIKIINHLRSLLEDYKLDGHRNQQTIEKLEKELERAKQEKTRVIESRTNQKRSYSHFRYFND